MATQNLDLNRIQPIFDHLLKGVERENRMEVMNESIIRLLEAQQREEVRDIFTYAHTVIRRTVFDYFRKNKRMIVQATILVNFCDGADEEEGTTVDNFRYETNEAGYGLADVRNDYFNNKSVFTPQESRIIDYMLFTDEGMDMKPTEISNTLGINKSHASRAMNKLKKVCHA